MNDLIFIGAGGHAHDITSIVEEYNRQHSEYNKFNIVGYLSDEPDYFNNKFPVLGKVSDIPVLSKVMRRVHYVIAINNSKIREDIYNQYLKDVEHWYGAQIIHPTAHPQHLSVRWDAEIVVGPMAYISPGTELGRGIHINSGVTVNQSCVIGDFCTISPGVNICGDVTLGDRVQFGAGGVVINYKKIGNDVTVGSGSVVISDVPDGSTVVGVPAKPIKTNGQIVWG